MRVPAINPPPLAGERDVPTTGLAPSDPLRDPPPAQVEGHADDLLRIAGEFEAMVLAEMLAPMFANLDTEGLGGGGAGERMFRPMLVQEYADAMARAGGVGLADSLLRELAVLKARGSDGADR